MTGQTGTASRFGRPVWILGDVSVRLLRTELRPQTRAVVGTPPPVGPARASTAEGRAQQVGSARRERT
jgi:hypothetical protein